jgi:hypothetical protein
MYTVVRFRLDEPNRSSKLEKFGAELNKVFPGSFDGLDKVPGRFSCSVHRNRDWDKHVAAILDFIEQTQFLIREFEECGGMVAFDTAIGKEDYKGRNVTSVDVPIELARVLVEYSIVLEFSYY